MLTTMTCADRYTRAVTGIVLALALTLAVGCARQSDLVIGDTPDSDLAGMVDSDAARQLLAELLARRSSGARLAAGTTPVIRLARLGVEGEPVEISRLPDQARLRELGREVSMDFAALVFAKALGVDSKSQAVQAAFDRFLREGPDRSSEALQRPSAFPYTLVFAPSWLYKSHSETGSDFAFQRGIATRLGIPNSLIASGQSDSVEVNAAVIADTLRTIGCGSGPIVVVSASKSGAGAADARDDHGTQHRRGARFRQRRVSGLWGLPGARLPRPQRRGGAAG